MRQDAEIQPLNLFVAESGQGSPLVILHGLLGMGDNWAMIGRRLSKQYNVIIPDLRNHGGSPHSACHSYEAMAADIQALCAERGWGKIHLLGHSMGGKAAMTLAFREPALVDRLIIADIGPGSYRGDSQHIELITAMMSVKPEEANSRNEIDELLKASVKDQKIRRFILKNITRNGQNQLSWRPNLPVLLANLESIMEGIDPDGLFLGRTLFLKGAKSDYISALQCDLIYKQFPLAEVVTLEDAGHWIHADDQEGFVSNVENFLNA